jgi:hypothetical protein
MIMTDNFFWTQHAKAKLRQYRLSEGRIKRILRFPKRLEIGIAPNTVAAMQPAGSKRHPYEIWAMWALAKARDKFSTKTRDKSPCRKRASSKSKHVTIISTWKYPGISPVHESPPIPDDTWAIVRKRTNC